MKNVFFIGVLFFSFAVSAAEGDSTSNAEKEPWSFATAEKRIKFTPLELLSIVPTLSVDLDVKYTDDVRFQGGFGYIPSFIQPTTGGTNDRNFDWMGGYKLRLESKFFILKKPNRYFSSEISVRHLIISDMAAIGMEGDGNGNFAYFMDQKMIFNRFSTQLSMKLGFEKEWESGFLFDFYGGLAIRQNFVQSNSKIPDGGVIQRNWNTMDWNLVDNHKMTIPTPILGFRIGYKLK